MFIGNVIKLHLCLCLISDATCFDIFSSMKCHFKCRLSVQKPLNVRNIAGLSLSDAGHLQFRSSAGLPLLNPNLNPY